MCNFKSNTAVKKPETPRTVFFHGVDGAINIDASHDAKRSDDMTADRFSAEAKEIEKSTDTSFAKHNGMAGRVFCK